MVFSKLLEYQENRLRIVPNILKAKVKRIRETKVGCSKNRKLVFPSVIKSVRERMINGYIWLIPDINKIIKEIPINLPQKGLANFNILLADDIFFTKLH